MSVVVSFSLAEYARFRVALEREFGILPTDDSFHIIEVDVKGGMDMFRLYNAMAVPIESPRVEIQADQITLKYRITNPSAEILLLSGSMVGPVLDENVGPVRSGVFTVDLNTGNVEEHWESMQEEASKERVSQDDEFE